MCNSTWFREFYNWLQGKEHIREIACVEALGQLSPKKVELLTFILDMEVSGEKYTTKVQIEVDPIRCRMLYEATFLTMRASINDKEELIQMIENITDLMVPEFFIKYGFTLQGNRSTDEDNQIQFGTRLFRRVDLESRNVHTQMIISTNNLIDAMILMITKLNEK